MSRRKLALLGYPTEVVNFNNENHIRELVVWLEDQCIRAYKIEDREVLRRGDMEVWNREFLKYLMILKCPYACEGFCIREVVDWLLDYSILDLYAETRRKDARLTMQIVSSFIAARVASLTAAELAKLKDEKESQQKASDPISALNFQADEFKDGIERLRKLLGIGSHPDSDVVLKAACKFIMDNLSGKAVELFNGKTASETKAKVHPLSKLDMGMISTKNAAVDAAVRALRLIHLENLREIQTEINEVIVAVQELTADPKTDKRLGKVGF